MFASLWSPSIQAQKTAITTVGTGVSYWWVGKLVYYCCCLLALTDIRSISQHGDVRFKISERVLLLPLEVTYTPSVLSAWLCICCIYCAESCQWINSEAQRVLWDDSLFAWMHSSSVFIKTKSKLLKFKTWSYKRDKEQLQMVDKGNSLCIWKVTTNLSALLVSLFYGKTQSIPCSSAKPVLQPIFNPILYREKKQSLRRLPEWISLTLN